MSLEYPVFDRAERDLSPEKRTSVLDTSRQPRKRRKTDGEFDPARYTGKHTVRSRLGDIVYICKLQLSEMTRVLRSARRIVRDSWLELTSKLRK